MTTTNNSIPTFRYRRNDGVVQPEYNPAHTGADEAPAEKLIGTPIAGSFWDTRVGPGNPIDHNDAKFEKIIPRLTGELFLTTEDVIQYTRGRISGAAARALVKGLMLVMPQLVCEKPEIILMQLVYQVMLVTDKKTATWMKRNKKWIMKMFGCMSFGTALANISTIRGRDADIEVEHNPAFMKWLAWRLGVDLGNPKQVATMQQTRARREWVIRAGTAHTCGLRANALKQRHPQHLRRAPRIAVFKLKGKSQKPVSELTVKEILAVGA